MPKVLDTSIVNQNNTPVSKVSNSRKNIPNRLMKASKIYALRNALDYLKDIETKSKLKDIRSNGDNRTFLDAYGLMLKAIGADKPAPGSIDTQNIQVNIDTINVTNEKKMIDSLNRALDEQ